MSCCGNKRNEFIQSLSGNTSPGMPGFGKKMWQDVLFEYTGTTALTVKGYITGKTYRFSKTGHRQVIDYRDASGMMAIPALKKVNQ
jgi:hypothetical protein